MIAFVAMRSSGRVFAGASYAANGIARVRATGGCLAVLAAQIEMPKGLGGTRRPSGLDRRGDRSIYDGAAICFPDHAQI